jgi:hypothetical protein
MQSLSRIPFDPREVRVISGLARWMGMLGRFQILASTFLFVMLLAVAALVTAAEVLEPAAGAHAQQPLVSIGDVSRVAIAIVVAVVVGFSLVFFRGGMLLISAAEDLETVDETEKNAHHIEDALRRLRGYFVLESIVMVALAGAVYAATILEAGPS